MSGRKGRRTATGNTPADTLKEVDTKEFASSPTNGLRLHSCVPTGGATVESRPQKAAGETGPSTTRGRTTPHRTPSVNPSEGVFALLTSRAFAFSDKPQEAFSRKVPAWSQNQADPERERGKVERETFTLLCST